MIGVTVGIGPDDPVAQEAARRFRKYTGLEAVVLGEDAFKQSGLRLPHMLRLHLFDFVDEDAVVYFDADLWFQRTWNPRKFDDGRMHVVRDIAYTGHIIKDSLAWAIPTNKYFNSGFMIVNKVHAPVLKQAAALMDMLYTKLPTLMYEQAPLNAAVHSSGIEVNYLDRRYNWVQCSLRWMTKGIPVIGAHKYVPDQKGSAMFDTTVDPDTTKATWDVKDSDLRELSGIYKYTRVGYDNRTIELLPDGTIGRGRANLEQWWLPLTKHGDRHIMLFGFPRNNMHWEDEICILSETPDGFSGEWAKHEKMPILLERSSSEGFRQEVSKITQNRRAAVLCRLLEERPAHKRRVAEIGVWEGETSQAILSSVPDVTYHMVDPWSAQTSNHEGYEGTNDHVTKLTQRQMSIKQITTVRRTAFAEDNLSIHRMESVAASKLFTDGYFDLVFIDADHSYQAVLQDISSWWPKVGTGGILSGHDYNYPTTDGSNFGPQVKQAVDEFVEENGLSLHTDEDYTWYVRKP